jgi:hypothetical protein
MKKITSLLSLALVCSVGFAQSNVTTAKEMGDASAPTVVFGNQSSNLAPCDYDGPSNNFENGFGPANDPSVIWADDFVVNIDEVFTVTQVGINVLTEPGVEVDEADIFFYEDSGVGPGSEVASFLQWEVATQEIVGTAFGFDVRRVVFDIDPTDFVGSAGAQTTYWMGAILVYGGASVYFENSTIIQNNEAYAFSDGAWYPTPEVFADPGPSVDFVRTISGECNVLNVNSNALSQVAVYPNPTSDVLNIQTPANVDVTSVVLFDILGKKVNADYNNSAINMTSLSQGVYILKVETSAGTLTQKVVKQ